MALIPWMTPGTLKSVLGYITWKQEKKLTVKSWQIRRLGRLQLPKYPVIARHRKTYAGIFAPSGECFWFKSRGAKSRRCPGDPGFDIGRSFSSHRTHYLWNSIRLFGPLANRKQHQKTKTLLVEHPHPLFLLHTRTRTHTPTHTHTHSTQCGGKHVEA